MKLRLKSADLLRRNALQLAVCQIRVYNRPYLHSISLKQMATQYSQIANPDYSQLNLGDIPHSCLPSLSESSQRHLPPSSQVYICRPCPSLPLPSATSTELDSTYNRSVYGALDLLTPFEAMKSSKRFCDLKSAMQAGGRVKHSSEALPKTRHILFLCWWRRTGRSLRKLPVESGRRSRTTRGELWRTKGSWV